MIVVLFDFCIVLCCQSGAISCILWFCHCFIVVLLYPAFWSPYFVTKALDDLSRLTTKWHVRPAKTQISLGIRPVWSVLAVRMKKQWVLCYPLSALRRLGSDWADAQADPSLRWAQRSFCWFCREAAHLCPHSVVSCFSALPLVVGGRLRSLIVALPGDLFRYKGIRGQRNQNSVFFCSC